MDNLILRALIEELKPPLLEQHCAQAIQVGPLTISLEFSGRTSRRLVLDLTDPPLCFLSARNWTHEAPSSFVSLLRKWLTGKKLLNLVKPADERILRFEFSAPAFDDSSGVLTLLVELIPRWGNVYLLDSSGAVLGFLLPARAERRHLEAGRRYAPPAKHGTLSLEEFAASAHPPELPSELDELVRNVRGLSPPFASEILHRARASSSTPAQALSQMLAEMKGHPTSCRIYQAREPHAAPILSPMELRSLAERPFASFDSVHQALESIYEGRFENALRDEERRSTRRYLQASLKRFRRIEEKLSAEAAAFSKELDLKRLADMILAQPGELHPRGDRLELVDCFEADHPKVTIPVDPRLTPIKNAQRFYERSKRARRGLERIQKRQNEIRRTVALVESALQRLEEVQSLAEIEEIAKTAAVPSSRPKEPSTRAMVSSRTPAISTSKKKKCRVFASSDGREILLGRNSKENDWVTTHYAQAEDYWFHVADYAGSHVVLRNPERGRLEETPGFLEAAQLAAYFSQARNARKVQVHWTQRKFVKKPKRAKPGLVTLSKFQSLLVEPKLPPNTGSSDRKESSEE